MHWALSVRCVSCSSMTLVMVIIPKKNTHSRKKMLKKFTLSSKITEIRNGNQSFLRYLPSESR